MQDGKRLVAIADVQRAHGIRGELRVRPYHDGRALLSAGGRLVLALRSGEQVPATVAHARPVPGALLVGLVGVDDRTKAEAFQGAEVLAARDDFPEPEPDEVYVCDLEGATAYWGERVLGVVTGVIDYPTCQALVVALPQPEAPAAAEAPAAPPKGRRPRRAPKPARRLVELEIPMLDGFVTEVDVAAKRVRVERVDELAPELGPRGG